MTEPGFLIQGGVPSTLFENLVLRLLHVLATSAGLSSYLVPCVFSGTRHLVPAWSAAVSLLQNNQEVYRCGYSRKHDWACLN